MNKYTYLIILILWLVGCQSTPENITGNQPEPYIFNPATKSVYIPKSVKGKFDWHNKDMRNWYIWSGRGIDFIEENKELIWRGKGCAGMASWLAFDKNKDIGWSADCKINTPVEVGSDCGIVFYHQEMYYARLLLVGTSGNRIFLAGHHFRIGHPNFYGAGDARTWAKPEVSRDWRNTWVNFRFEYKADKKELRLYRNDNLCYIAKDWDASHQPHPVMHLQCWVDNEQAEFFLKNIRITEGDLGCWSLSPTRMSGGLASTQITTANLHQEAPADAQGHWVLVGNAVTGTLITPLIKLCPERSFTAIRIESSSSDNNKDNNLLLTILDERNKPISDRIDIVNGVWSKDLSRLKKQGALRFRIDFSRNSANTSSPVLYWVDVDTKIKTEEGIQLPKRDDKRQILIGAWGGPPATDEQYKILAEGNFNWVISGDLDLAAKHGIKVVAGTNSQKDKPALWGYYLADEPSLSGFAGLAKQVTSFRENDPEHPGYINLYPNYCPVGDLGAKTYEEYVDKFLEIVKPEILSYDHYCFFQNKEGVPGDGPGYFANLEVIRRLALKYNVPFCNVIQGTSWGWEIRLPTEEEVRWLVYTTLAYGGKAFAYYRYWGNNSVKGIVNAKDGKTEQYANVRAVNKEAKTIGPYLVNLASRGVYHTGEIPQGCIKLPEGASVSKVSDGNFVVGLFSDDENRSYVFLVNSAYRKASETTVTLNGKVKEIYELDYQSGKWIKVVFEVKGEESIFKVSFRPGAGKLYFIPGLMLIAPTGASHTSAFLGIQPAESGDPAAMKDKTDGVRVKVIQDAPAAKFGIQSDDIIIEMDGKKTRNWFELTEIIATHKPDDKVNVKLLRDNKEISLTVTLGAR
jgi:hypothetical protein